MERITPMEGIVESKTTYTTQSTGNSAIFNLKTVDANDCKRADFVECTGDSATTGNIGTSGIDPMDDLVERMRKCKITTEFQPYIPASWPIKQNMYVGMDTSMERYVQNLHLLGRAWVRKVQHVARLTLNSTTGPVWPTDIEPLALVLFDFLNRRVHWGHVPERADFADELDFVWRVRPHWLPPQHRKFMPLWEYVTGMARTWSWHWHNEVRKQGAPEDRHPRSRFYQNSTSAARHHHVLAGFRVPPVASYIRTNKFYRVGDDETACERPEPSPRCHDKCHHTEAAHALKRLKKKYGLIRAPGVEPENEHEGIE